MSRNIIHLPTIPPRTYQLDFWKAVESGVKNIILSYPRRGGKDLTSAMFLCKEAMTNVGSYWVLGPTKRHAVDIYWTGVNDIPYICPFTGERKVRTGSILDIAIPKELRRRTNKSENFIELLNGSTIKLGGTSEESFVGQTGKGFVLTEYSLPEHSDNVLPLLNPIVAESGGWILINGTQRETDNRLNLLIEKTKDNKKWYTTYQTMEDIKQTCLVSHDGEYNINPELLDAIDPVSGRGYPNIQDMIDVEPHKKNVYVREFINIPIEGGVRGYYEDAMEYLKSNTRLVHWDSTKPVYTAWDLGLADKTAIVFFQLGLNNDISVIDYYENSGQNVGHYVQIIRGKSYRYGRHFVPTDASARSYLVGMDLIAFCKKTHNFTMHKLAKTVSLKSDIELVREMLPMMTFESERTVPLQNSLWSYHEGTNGKPCHNNNCKECKGASHAADAFRYMCVAINSGLCIPTLSEAPVYDTRVRHFEHNQRHSNGFPMFVD